MRDEQGDDPDQDEADGPDLIEIEPAFGQKPQPEPAVNAKRDRTAR